MNLGIKEIRQSFLIILISFASSNCIILKAEKKSLTLNSSTIQYLFRSDYSKRITNYVSILDIQLDNIGRRWTIFTINGNTEPLIQFNRVDFLRLGLGASVFDLYKSKEMPPVLYNNGGTRVDESKYGLAMGLFSLYGRISLCSWPVYKRLTGGIFLYGDYWWLRSVMNGATNPADYDMDSESPAPKRFIETGIGFCPFGTLVTLKLYYRYLSIPYTTSTDVMPSSTWYNVTLYTKWYFGGYKEDRFGISLVINLGATLYE
jgi:hypothetical protein